MSYALNQDTEYVVIRDGRPKKAQRYYYPEDDDDDDADDYFDEVDDHGDSPVVRRVTRRKPVREQRIKYITNEPPESEYRSHRHVESKERSIRVRQTTNGEQVLIDEDDNIIKVIRNTRSPTPPMIEQRRIHIRPRENHRQYYTTHAAPIVKSRPRKQIIVKRSEESPISEEEPARIIRKIIIDPNNVRTQARVPDKERIRKIPKDYVLQQQPVEIRLESDDIDRLPDKKTQYVEVIQKPIKYPTTITRKEPSTKYVMIRKKGDTSDPVYAVTSSVPVVKNRRRIVYENPSKDASTNANLLYEADEKN